MNKDIGGVLETRPEELKKMKRKCNSPSCRYKAFLTDWTGWKWCLKHWYRNCIWSDRKLWREVKKTRLF